jgi:pimeloyl-ACP methyl ester carboxylesterase
LVVHRRLASVPSFLTALAVLVSLGACGADTPTSPDLAPSAAKVASPPSATVETAGGFTGPGSLYALYKPTQWNGRLVIYAHGYVDPDLGVSLPAIEPLRDALVAQGFAVAYSSYSENGFAIKDGVQRTHQLKGLFRARFGKPSRTYVIGHSLGGIITAALAESYPGDYDGAMPMCGLVGGSEAELAYIANVRLLFDTFYPGLLPGSVLDVPAGLDFATQVAPGLVGYFTANPAAAQGLGAIASFDQAPLPYASGSELVNSALQALGFQFNGIGDLLDRTHGNSPIDNTTTVYTAAALPPQLVAGVNASIGRVATTPDAKNYIRKYYEPTGRLKIPVLTLHTTRDPIVPIFHEGLYAQRAAAAGSSNLLVQRSITRYGHCTFSGTEMVTGLAQLVAWAEAGVKPAP